MTQKNSISPKIQRLTEKIKRGEHSALDAFWAEAENTGTPIIEDIEGDEGNCLATLIWKENEELHNISVMGEAFGMNTEETKLSKLEDTDLWYRSFIVPKGTRSLYIFTLNVPEGDCQWEDIDSRTDPLNPKIYTCPKDPERPDMLALLCEKESYAEFSGFEQNPCLKQRQDGQNGTMVMERFKSDILQNERDIWIYTPWGYDANQGPYGLAVFTDGWEYANITEAPAILDNLIAGKYIPPVCALFIDNRTGRDEELGCNEAFGDFIAKELVPYLHSRYTITDNSKETLIAGFSRGGLTAAFVGLRHADVFGKVLSQSGSFWQTKEAGESEEQIVKNFREQEKRPLAFYISTGVFERQFEFHYDANQRLVQVLKEKGYPVTYSEFGGGHTNFDCQLSLPEGLVALLGS